VVAAPEFISLEVLQLELLKLERREQRLSAQRRKLHARIDGGFANEITFAQEREVSEARLAVHHQIDALRAQVERMR
jgi:hypothetical protein